MIELVLSYRNILRNGIRLIVIRKHFALIQIQTMKPKYKLYIVTV